MVCPECYVLEDERMSLERDHPETQVFFPIDPSESSGHHLWSNAIYIIALLLRIIFIFT
jgi:hypothetical protein